VYSYVFMCMQALLGLDGKMFNRWAAINREISFENAKTEFGYICKCD